MLANDPAVTELQALYCDEMLARTPAAARPAVADRTLAYALVHPGSGSTGTAHNAIMTA